MPLISKSFIRDELIPKLDVYEVVQNYLGGQLKKAGANYQCCCPFHSEKTPSFVVNRQKQFYHCFGCGLHGTAIDFVVRYKNLSFPEAIEELARFVNIPVVYEKTGKGFGRYAERMQPYYDLMERVAVFYTQQLHSNPQAMSYFTNTRGLSMDTINKARLGYAPGGFDALVQAVVSNEADYKRLVELGMQTDRYRDSKHLRYPFLRNRVVFPIFDVKGRIISFGGRLLDGEGPKYLNTAESPIFKKRRELFGLYECLQANRNRPQEVIVVEGYMDAIGLRQAGFNNVVATLGTAITSEHITLLFRYTDKIVCCFDGDEAGRKASWRALQAITPVLNTNKEVLIATIPSGHDPDTFVRSFGEQAFRELVSKAMSYPESLVLHQSYIYNVKEPNARSVFINSLISIIKAIPLPTMQQVTLEVLAKFLGWNMATLNELFKSPDIQADRNFLAKDEDYGNNTHNVTHRQSIASKFATGELKIGAQKRGYERWNREKRHYDRTTDHTRTKEIRSQYKPEQPQPQIRSRYEPRNSYDQAMAGTGELNNIYNYNQIRELNRHEQISKQMHSPSASYMQLSPAGSRLDREDVDAGGDYYASYLKSPQIVDAERSSVSVDEFEGDADDEIQIDRSHSAASAPLSDQEMADYVSVVGKDFDYEDLNSQSYLLLAFMLQQPSLVHVLHPRYDLEKFLSVAKLLKVVEYPCLERLTKFIIEHSKVSCAMLIEEYRESEFEPLFSLLMEIPVVPQVSSGEDMSILQKSEIYANLLVETIREPLNDRIHELSAKGLSTNQDDLNEVMLITKAMNQGA